MGKNDISSHQGERNKKREIHPIWKGIGIGLIILTPILAYYGTLVLLDLNNVNRWFAIPRDLIMKGFSDPLVLVKAILTIVLMFLLYGFYSMISFSLYSAFGPSRYGPTDVPPSEFKGRGYKR